MLRYNEIHLSSNEKFLDKSIGCPPYPYETNDCLSIWKRLSLFSHESLLTKLMRIRIYKNLYDDGGVEYVGQNENVVAYDDRIDLDDV